MSPVAESLSPRTPSKLQTILAALKPVADLWEPYMARLDPASVLYKSSDPRAAAKGLSIQDIAAAVNSYYLVKELVDALCTARHLERLGN